MRRDGERLLGVLTEADLGGGDGDPLEDGVTGLLSRQPLLDPLFEDFIERPVRLQPLAPAMRDKPGSLVQEEAFTRSGSEHAPAAAFVDERGVIEVGIEPQQRERETILPAGLAVAGAGIAAQAGEDGDDVVFEADGALRRNVGTHRAWRIAQDGNRDGSKRLQTRHDGGVGRGNGAGPVSAGWVAFHHNRGEPGMSALVASQSATNADSRLFNETARHDRQGLHTCRVSCCASSRVLLGQRDHLVGVVHPE